MMLLNINSEEWDIPFVLDDDLVLTRAISFFTYRMQTAEKLNQYIRDHAGEHRKFGIYCYVSQSGEADEEIRSTVGHYCKEHADKIEGWDYVGTYIDIGYRYGSKFPERPDFHRMLDDARNGQLDLIVAGDMMRFAETVHKTLSITEELRLLPNPVLVVFENEKTDSDTLHQFMQIYGQPKSRKRRTYVGGIHRRKKVSSDK